MKTALSFLPAVFGLAAVEARGATLFYVSALRSVEGGGSRMTPSGEFADFDASLVGIVDDPNEGQRPGCAASQQSMLGTETINVVSSVSGDSGTGTSLFYITLHLDEAASYSLIGGLNLLGTYGFACVTFQDLAHRDETLINEVLYAPPQISQSKPLSFTGTIGAGDYLLEAMIYAGGNHLNSEGRLDVVFSIPEPGAGMPALAALAALGLRRRGKIKIPPAAL